MPPTCWKYELAHFHAVEPDLPAEPPGAEGRALPIVLDKADVVLCGIDAERGEALQVQFLAVGRRRFQDDLQLVVMLQPVRVFAVAPVGRAARGLHIGGAPRLRPERAQCRRRVKRAGADLDIIGLQDDAALLRPIALQGQDQPLKAVIGFAAHVSGWAWTARLAAAARARRDIGAADTARDE